VFGARRFVRPPVPAIVKSLRAATGGEATVAFRAFRLNRMGDLVLTGGHFRPRRVPMLRDYIVRLRAESIERAKDRAADA